MTPSSEAAEIRPALPAEALRQLPTSDLAVLRTMVSFPHATDEELAKALGLSRPTITRARMRLSKRGLWEARFAVDLDRAYPGAVVVACGNLAREANEEGFAVGAAAVLKEQHISGGLVVEGSSFCALLLPGPLERLHAWQAAMYDLRVRPGGAHAVASLEAHPFLAAKNVRRTIVDFEGLVEAVTGKVKAAAGLTPRPAPRAKAPRALRKNEFLVAKELISHPDRSVADGASAVGLSRSTFAHVKSRLLSEGLLRREVWINLPAFGFPYLLFVAVHRRPPTNDTSMSLTERVFGQRVPPISFFSSPLHEVTVIPYRDLGVARELVNRMRLGIDDPKLLGTPFVAVFDLTRTKLVAHSEPGDVMAAWFTPIK